MLCNLNEIYNKVHLASGHVGKNPTNIGPLIPHSFSKAEISPL